MTNRVKPPAVMGTYGRFPIELVRGKGVEVYDRDEKRYLDFLGGISVLCLGHSPDRLVNALKDQAEKIWHTSNLYHIGPQQELAQKLVDHSCMDQAFFCNSGTEANEGALKLARIASEKLSGHARPVFVAMNKSFHGRSFGSLSVTGQEAYQAPFQPLLPEVRFADFNDLDSLNRVMGEDVAAVIVEPLQAEGGLNAPAPGYLEDVKQCCEKHGSLMIYDEVQVGMGRFGSLFAYQHYGVEPDIMTLAKGLGGGFPVGAVLAKHEVSQHFVPGTHASTFGGNHLACRVAGEVVDALLEPGFFNQVKASSEKIKHHFEQLIQKHAALNEVRGEGLLLGLSCEKAVGDILKACMKEGLLIGSAGANVIRLAPPLNIEDHYLEEGLSVLSRVLETELS
jgi:predicted acetylornithine/succinylornithine family transaminase